MDQDVKASHELQNCIGCEKCLPPKTSEEPTDLNGQVLDTVYKEVYKVTETGQVPDATGIPDVEKVVEYPFHEFMLPADGPVIPGLEPYEIIFAKTQPEYRPLRALRALEPQGRVMSRWTFTPEQREAIARGADILLTLMTFNQRLQPITLAVAEKPEHWDWATDFNLPPNLEEHKLDIASIEKAAQQYAAALEGGDTKTMDAGQHNLHNAIMTAVDNFLRKKNLRQPVR